MNQANDVSRHSRGRRRAASSRQASPRTTTEDRQKISAWFIGRLPADWFTAPAAVDVDDDEIVVVGVLPEVALGTDATSEDLAVAESARISGYREDTREHRMRIAEEAQVLFGRRVSWGASSGATTHLFTTASVPVMTRLRMADRQVLDTLIDAGVARSRSEALAWCVRLVGQNESQWIGELRAAFDQVDAVRSRGPESGQPSSES